ncbi:hypothetical protein, partial [Corallococcus sp. CA031C]
AAPPAPPQPLRTPTRQQSLFEPPHRREAALRQWSSQNGGTPATGLQQAPVRAGGSGNTMKPMFLDGTAGGVQQASEARTLTGAGAYAVLETRVKNAQAAEARLDAVEQKLAEELAIIGPLLTPEERNAFIQSFRTEHAAAYTARDAAVGELADHLEAEGANIEAYLKDVQGISPYMLGLHAVPVQQALMLVADSPRAATAVAYLNASENQLLQQLGDPAGQYLEQDVYGPAINATLTSALASGQSSDNAIAGVTALIQQMPEGVQERILGADPKVMLGALASVASGNVGALKNLAAEAGKLGTPGATALVSAALSMAMIQSPELLQDPAALNLLIQPLGNAGMTASAVSMALKGVGSVVTRIGFQSELGGAPMLLGKLGTILGAATSGLRVLNLLSQADRNNGTYLQVGAQAVGGIVSTASVFGLVGGPLGIGVAATTFVLTELGKAWEKGIHREEAAKASIERATQLGIPDAQMRVNLGFNYGTQVRELASLGIDYQRMNEIIPRFTDTTRLALLAQGLELSPEEVGRVLDLVVPPGTNSTVEVTGFNLLMGLYQQARTANPGGTPEQLVAWMRNNAPPPLHGGSGYLFMGSMLNLLASAQ